MKQHYIIWFLVAILICSTGCEKQLDMVEDPPAKEDRDTTTTDSTGTIVPETGIDPTIKQNALTVAEAQLTDAGHQICVKAYIVGTAYKSLNNILLWPPFTSSTSILLSDTPIVTDSQTDETIDINSLLPVCLTDRASIRKKLNLKDNPELWNRQVYIIGTRDYYMNGLGLKIGMEYEIVKAKE